MSNYCYNNAMSDKKKLQRITLLTAIFTLISFLYKAGLGVYSMSLVLIVASISTLMVFIAKMAFVNNVTKSRKDKKKAYFSMFLATLIYSLVFLLFVVLKVNGIDISNQKEYEGWLGILLISFMIIMFILSVIKLRGALEKTDIMVIGLKEITFISALSDLVIIESFVYGILLRYEISNDILTYINSYFPLGIAIIMLITSLVMLIRYIRYKATN